MEKNIIRKIIAKEWLFLLGSLLFSITLFPIIFWLIVSIFVAQSGNFSEGYKVFLGGLFFIEKRDVLDSYIFVLIPYFLVQFVRSVIWAIKVIRQK